jgi:hypothetical protein
MTDRETKGISPENLQLSVTKVNEMSESEEL